MTQVRCQFREQTGGCGSSPFDIETKDLNSVIVLTLDCLLSRIEFLSLVDILAAGVTSPTSGNSLNEQGFQYKKIHVHRKGGH